jgi:hypothetical protein
MVTTGVFRGYGNSFRRWLGRSLGTRTSAFMAGLAVTALLQSSTATGLIDLLNSQRHDGARDGTLREARGKRGFNAGGSSVVI